jgi:Zn-dependent membrane protease YugP
MTAVAFDPIYLLFMLPGLLLSLWASMRTKSAFAKYSRVQSARGLTGAQAAEMLLSRAGIRDVAVEPTRGMLTTTTP